MKTIQQVQDDFNNNPCPYCGKTHHVEFSLFGKGANAIVSYAFSEDACQAFRRDVEQEGGYAQLFSSFPLP